MGLGGECAHSPGEATHTKWVLSLTCAKISTSPKPSVEFSSAERKLLSPGETLHVVGVSAVDVLDSRMTTAIIRSSAV